MGGADDKYSQQELSKLNFVARKKYEAIDYWDRKAQARIREGKNFRGFGNWGMKQLAKAHAESWHDLALDILTLGRGRLLVKYGLKGLEGIKRARTITTAEKFIQESAKAREIVITGKGRARYIRAPTGKWAKVPEPGITTKIFDKVARPAGKGIKSLPKYIEPIIIKGEKIVTPRRGLKAGGLAYREIKYQIKSDPSSQQGINISRPVVSIPDKPLKSIMKLGPHTPPYQKHKWVFPPIIVTAKQPIFNPLKNLVPQKINFQLPSAFFKNPGQKNVQSRPIPNPLKNMRPQGVNIKPANPPRGNIQQQSSNLSRPAPFKPPVPAFKPMPVFRPPPAFRPVPVFRPPAFRGR